MPSPELFCLILTKPIIDAEMFGWIRSTKVCDKANYDLFTHLSTNSLREIFLGIQLASSWVYALSATDINSFYEIKTKI